ncbi:lipid A deacylase LpxR family protein [Polaribacter vadi]|uniref:lipid A deacylase LpxR family protein n=1 Tax=Polaribacter TaxID=52959 RepID=UPI001C09D288|nr:MULTISPECIES: lipid A deacylase LpxR family protein [Polaribacter]MBU3012236.1 lipid A deacylase LpxR family protein [Polaribacter vadi]MDO6742052.1 lipid A deacylase LpxR family protein [Polaribacter sp. 1_MG-2023]
MKNRIFIIIFFVSLSISSQQKYAKEISFVNDNDLYASVDRDRYYTNGMFLTYRYLTKNNNKNLDKKIIEWQIGHKMYTPYKPVVKTINLHDRPFAGYLYAGFGLKKVYKKNKILNTSLQIGIVGPNAYGKELQDFIHDIYGFEEATGWQYQIENAFGLNFGTEYITSLTNNESNTFDISWANSANLGTVFTNINSGFNLRFGFTSLQKMANSIAFNTNLNDDKTKFKREIESFFYMKPILQYNFYDATIQGSFLNNNSLVTKEIVPLVFNIELGIKFTANRFNFGYIFNYNTNKTKDLRYTYGHKYGTISINYLLR